MIVKAALFGVFAKTCLGTIIVLIPTRDGIIIAADSRATASDNRICDSRKKIIALPEALGQPTAFAASGLTEIAEPGTALTDYKNICDAIQRVPKALDVQREIEIYLSGRDLKSLADLKLLGARLEQAVTRFKNKYPAETQGFEAGKNLFDVRIAKYEPERRKFIMADGALAMSAEGGRPVVKTATWDEYDGTSAPVLSIEGDAAFLSRFVLNEGSELNRRWKRMPSTPLLVSQGATEARLAIQTAYAAVREHPAGWNIGGPVHVYLVSRTGVQSLN